MHDMGNCFLVIAKFNAWKLSWLQKYCIKKSQWLMIVEILVVSFGYILEFYTNIMNLNWGTTVYGS